MPDPATCRAGRGGALVLGVDLGGTKVRAALADAAGTVLGEQVQETDPRGGRHVVDQIAALARLLTAEAGVPAGRVRATAVGSPGVPDSQSGALELSPNIDGLTGISLRDELADRLGHPVVLDNDVTVAAVGERWAGSARGYDDFVFVAVGTGVGMGIVSGGRVLRGAHGAAGEIGYLPLGSDPFDRANQIRGPLEEAAAGETVAARYHAATGTARTPREVFDLAGAGDPVAAAVVADLGAVLALAITAVAAVLDPSLVVLGGGVGSRPELLTPVRAGLAALGKAPVDVVTTALGHRASVVGALHLALRTARLGFDSEDTR